MKALSKVLLIGAGALGSRHLQSLAGDPDIERIMVVEPNGGARAVAEERWRAIEGHAGKTLLFSNMDDLGTDHDAAVIATPSPGRLDVLRAVLDRGIRQVLCEKVLFQTVADLDAAVALVEATGSDIRVNHIYRYAEPFPQLRGKGGDLRLSVNIGGDGMGCNLIHYLDLLEYLSGSVVRHLDVEIVQPAHPSKRGPAYLEFEGAALARTANGNEASIRYVTGPARAPRITVARGMQTVSVDEAREEIAGLGNGSDRFDAPRVSGLTARILREQREGGCLLPTLAESAPANRLMLERFNQQLFGRHAPDLLCPVT